MFDINRYTATEPLKFGLSFPLIEQLTKVVDQLDQRYQTSRTLVDAIYAGTRLAHLEQDAQAATAYMKSVHDRVDDILSRHGHNYLAAHNELLNLKSAIARETAPGTQPYTILKNYEAFVQADAENRKALSEGKITEAQYEGFRNYVNKIYPGAIPTGNNTFHRLELPSLVPYVNVDNIADTEISKLPVRERKEDKLIRLANGDLEIKTEHVKYLDHDEAAQTLRATIEGNPNAVQFLRQQAFYSGKDPDTAVDDYINDYINRQLTVRTGTIFEGNEIQYKPVSRGRTRTKEQDSSSHNTGETVFGGLLDQSADYFDFQDVNQPYTPDIIEKITPGATVADSTSMAKFFTVDSTKAKDEYLPGMTTIPLGDPGRFTKVRVEVKYTKQVSPLQAGIDKFKGKLVLAMPQVIKASNPWEVLTYSEQVNHKVNVALLSSIVEEFRRRGKPETKQTAQEIWRIYNMYRNVPVSHAFTWTPVNGTKTVQSIVNALVPSISSANAPIYEFDVRKHEFRRINEAKERRNIVNELFDIPSTGGTADIRLKGLFQGFSNPASANVPFGLVFSPGQAISSSSTSTVQGYQPATNKYYIIVPPYGSILKFNYGQAYDRKLTSEAGGKTTDFSNSDRYNVIGFAHVGREIGQPFKIRRQKVDERGRVIGSDEIYLIGKLEYEPSSNGVWLPTVRYYHTRNNGTRLVPDFERVFRVTDPYTGQQVDANPNHVLSIMLKPIVDALQVTHPVNERSSSSTKNTYPSNSPYSPITSPSDLD